MSNVQFLSKTELKSHLCFSTYNNQKSDKKDKNTEYQKNNFIELFRYLQINTLNSVRRLSKKNVN